MPFGAPARAQTSPVDKPLRYIALCAPGLPPAAREAAGVLCGLPSSLASSAFDLHATYSRLTIPMANAARPMWMPSSKRMSEKAKKDPSNSALSSLVLTPAQYNGKPSCKIKGTRAKLKVPGTNGTRYELHPVEGRRGALGTTRPGQGGLSLRLRSELALSIAEWDKLGGVGALTEGEWAESGARISKLETSTNDGRSNVQNGRLKARSADAGFCHLDFGP